MDPFCLFLLDELLHLMQDVLPIGFVEFEDDILSFDPVEDELLALVVEAVLALVFDRPDIETGGEEILEAVALPLPYLVELSLPDEDIDGADDLAVLPELGLSLVDKRGRSIGLSAVFGEASQTQDVRDQGVVLLPGASKVGVLLISQRFHLAGGKKFLCLPLVQDVYLLLGGVEISGPDLGEGHVVVKEDVALESAGEDRLLIGFQNGSEVELGGEGIGGGGNLAVADDAAQKEGFRIAGDEVLDDVLRLSKFPQNSLVQGIDALDDDAVVVLSIDDEVGRNALADDLGVLLRPDSLVLTELLDVPTGLLQVVDGGLVEVEFRPFLLQPLQEGRHAGGIDDIRERVGDPVENLRGVLLVEGHVIDDVFDPLPDRLHVLEATGKIVGVDLVRDDAGKADVVLVQGDRDGMMPVVLEHRGEVVGTEGLPGGGSAGDQDDGLLLFFENFFDEIEVAVAPFVDMVNDDHSLTLLSR